MPRKKPHIHYIYKTTCNFNQKYYIGMHSTSNLEDGYMGSGKRLRYSIRKYGKDNHTKIILEFLPNRESLKEREIEIVNSDLLLDENCINLKIGGYGGGKFYSEEHRLKCSKAGNEMFLKKMQDDEFRNNLSSRSQNIIIGMGSEELHGMQMIMIQILILVLILLIYLVLIISKKLFPS